jgi:acetyl esterase/lipase
MLSIPSTSVVWRPAIVAILLLPCAARSISLPEEKPLWPGTGWENTIHYDGPEAMREYPPGKMSLSGLNRVYSFVSTPSYTIHEPPAGTANGLGLVICPGGGFRELWLDREGHDLALWLKARGATSLVLKYRTNAEIGNGKRKYPPEVYLPAVVADARQAIRVLRSHLARARGNNSHVGICGFSAGGTLAMYSVFRPEPDSEANSVAGLPDLAGLFYPGLRDADAQLVAGTKRIPPIFIINAVDDHTTPVDRCVDFYQSLLKAGSPAELHLYNKGGHGFDMGDGHGDSVALWKESFLAWLKDSGFLGGPDSARPLTAGAPSSR